MALRLTSLNLGGNSYSLATDVFNTSSPGKGGYTAGNTVGAAALGAVIGAVAGGGPGAAIGAVAGTGVGLGASAATPGPRSVVPPEAVLSFHLTSPSYRAAGFLPGGCAYGGRVRTAAGPALRSGALRLSGSGSSVRAAAPRICSVSLCLRLSVSRPVCLCVPPGLCVRLPVLLPPLEVVSRAKQSQFMAGPKAPPFVLLYT